MADFVVDKEALQTLQSFGVGADDAFACLKHANNDLNAAADYFYSGGLENAKKNAGWDETAWTAPREGPGQLSSSTATRSYNNNYQVHGPDMLMPDVFESKTRPPSRASNPDEDMAKALALSTTEYGRQETGITGTNTSPISATFGPALPEKQYDPSSWALTTTKTEEVFVDPEPRQRRRKPGMPVLLKSSAYNEILGGALTILHSIPLARWALLAGHYQASDFFDEQWWSTGKRPQLQVIEDSEYSFEIVAEAQRIMAFLDKTERAYASVDSLADLARKQLAHDRQKDDISYFLKAWCNAVADPSRWVVFTSEAIQVKNEQPEKTSFQVLQLEESPASDPTIYGAIDSILWTDDDAEAYVDFSHIVCIDWAQKGVHIDIPACFYPDRYTISWLETTRNLRQNMQKSVNEIEALETRMGMLQSFRSKTGGCNYDPKALLEATIAHFNSSNCPSSDPVIDLRNIVTQLEQKLNDLSTRRQAAQESLQKLKRAFTAPEESDRPLSRYDLRGVIANSQDTYLVSENGWQYLYWDRTIQGWNDTPQAILNVETVTQEQVLTAARDAKDRLLLVYADALALEPRAEELPLNLLTFVERDNAAFSIELGETPCRKRRTDDDAVDGSASPKRASNRSSATIGAETPAKDYVSISSLGTDQDIVSQTVELPPTTEMIERGHVSPVAKAFHLESIERAAGLKDEEMPDAEHVERSLLQR